MTRILKFMRIRAVAVLLAVALSLVSHAGGSLFASGATAAEEARQERPQGPGGSQQAPAWFRAKPDLDKPRLSWDPPAGKSYAVPAAEIAGFVLALNGFSRLVYPNEMQQGRKIYDTTPSTFWNNLTHGDWGLDADAFRTNQLLHPYQGTIYHGFARSAGLSYWESAAYTFAGSILWETAGETTRPSTNDQIASGIAGSFLGEPLFRMASLLLEGHGEPGFWRELGAAVISPPTGFNRLVFGERFDAVFPSRDPALFWRLRLGATFNTRISDKGGSGIQQNEAIADFSMLYGLPGKPGYDYTRPFDYFQFDLTAVNAIDDPVGNLTTRGLLLGTDYEAGEAYRGIWGVYGGYDYLSARIFRVSSTAVSLGTTGQWWLSRLVALQGSVLSGIGYGAGSNISDDEPRQYHYGTIGQAFLSFRLIFGNLAMVEASGRGYYVSGLASDRQSDWDFVNFVNVGTTFRLWDRHAIGANFTASGRDSHAPGRADKHQRLQSVSLVYTFLSDMGFGAVEWR